MRHKSIRTFKQLSDIEQQLRMMFPTRMWNNDEVIVTIQLFGGFEYFGSYENWAEGYRVTTGERYGKLEVVSRHLDDALKQMQEKLDAWKASTQNSSLEL